MKQWGSAMTAQHWQQVQTETGEDGTTTATLDKALTKVLCIGNPSSSCVRNTLEPWADSIRARFNDEGHWFTAGWKSVSRAEPIAKTQVEFWSESVLKSGADAAAARDLRTRGGIACAISAKSSGLGATMFKANDANASASGGGVSRKWSLTTVPDDAKPDLASGVSEQDLLQDWKSLVAWQFYTIKKRRVRSRMRAIWKEFFSPTWGDLENPNSVSASTRVRNHSGVVMDKRAFDFSVTFV